MVAFWISVGLLLLFILVMLSFILQKSDCSCHDTLRYTVVLFLILSLISLPLYYYSGSFEKITLYHARQERVTVVKDKIKQAGSLSYVIDMLKAKLDKNPDSAYGWYLLSDIYLRSEQYALANSAIKKAYELSPNEDYIAEKYAETLFVLNRGSADKVLDTLLAKLGDSNPTVLNIKAIQFFKQQKYNQAITLWKRVLASVDQEGELKKTISTWIERAHTEIIKSKPVDKMASIPIEVNIDPPLKKLFPGNTVVFIYARRVSGNKMPLAMLKKSLADFPVTLSLSPLDAMVDSNKLAKGQIVQVVARLSPKGRAVKSEDDVEVVSQTIIVGEKKDTVKLLVS